MKIKTKSTLCAKRLPAFGAKLNERQKFINLPFMAVICVGQNCWDHAKAWNNSPTDIVAMVLTPEQPPVSLTFPVKDCLCLVEWGYGAPEPLIVELIKCLLKSGALRVIVRPLWVDLSSPMSCYDKDAPEGQRWVQLRETIKIYNQPHASEARYVA
ncbi:MAG: hypothetical protein ABL903_14140 [Methylococcales bacterium]